jgi:hypothetical protein
MSPARSGSGYGHIADEDPRPEDAGANKKRRWPFPYVGNRPSGDVLNGWFAFAMRLAGELK